MQRLSDLNRLIYITFSDSLTYPNPTCKIFSKIPASTIRVGGLGALDSVGIDTLLWSAGEMDVEAAGELLHSRCIRRSGGTINWRFVPYQQILETRCCLEVQKARRVDNLSTEDRVS